MTTTELALQQALSPEVQGDIHIVWILDRSGSMAGLTNDIIGGFNSFIRECRERNVPRCDVQYARFDATIEPSVFRLALADVPEMTPALYAPRGSTALFDAVGATISPIVTNSDDIYIVVIWTDGYENASREWTKEKVNALLKEREALGNWTFAFFGAEIDAWADGEKMGFSAGNTYAHSKADYLSMMRSSAKAASIMAEKGMRSSRRFAGTVGADSARGLSDEEAERMLREDEDAATPKP